jgi:hypothetical protein
LLDADQRGESVLGHQMRSRTEVSRLIADDALLACHQQVEVVVDHDRHLDAINRRENALILRQRPRLGLTDLLSHDGVVLRHAR